VGNMVKECREGEGVRGRGGGRGGKGRMVDWGERVVWRRDSGEERGGGKSGIGVEG